VAEVIKATDADFDERVVKSDLPVLVDFFGTWCGPCQKMKPMLADLAAELDGRAKVVEVEVSQAPEAAGKFDVLGVPTFVIVAGGEARETLSGTPSKADILKAIAPHL